MQIQGSPITALPLPTYAALASEDEAALSALYISGTPANTLRAWERDLAYIAAWKAAVFGRPLAWPEEALVALRFVLDHTVARAVVGWIETAVIAQGPLFRPISKSGRALTRKLSPDAIRVILRYRFGLAGLPPDYAPPHGFRAGFLTQAALDGAPLAAAMKLSLHRSAILSVNSKVSATPRVESALAKSALSILGIFPNS